MTTISTPRIFIAGTSSGVGKSFFTVGLAAALVQRGLSINVCLHGVRLPQSVLYRRISLRHPAVLDPQLLSPLQMLESFRLASSGADIVLIDGNLGLFDGQRPESWEGSDAWLAELLATPTVVVFDGGIFGASAGAVVKGFSDATLHKFSIDGAIANWLDLNGAPFRDRGFYEAVLASFAAPPLLGAIGTLPNASHPENMLPGMSVAQDRNRTLLGRMFILEVAKLVEDSVDIDALVAIARRAPQIQIEEEIPPASRRCRIAFSDDSCFHLGFPDNLSMLRHCGAELVPFSPLADTDLPARIGAVYLTGAYLGEYGQDIAANTDMKAALLNFVRRGGMVYAEGGGAAFLCAEFESSPRGAVLPGVGVLQGRAVQTTGDVDYLALEVIEPSILGEPGAIIRGVDSFEWRFEPSGPAPKATFRAIRGEKAAVTEGISSLPHVAANFAFLHWGSNAGVAQRFVDAAEDAARRLGD